MVRRLIASLIVLHVAVLGLATSGEAVGFRIAAHGAKAMGMDGAFAAQADDPSAIYYNPAGIAQLEGTQVQVGITFIDAVGSSYKPFPGTTTLNPGGTFGPAQSADIDSRVFYLPTFFVTHRFDDRFALGFGEYTPFGLQLDWPDNWTGRQITTFNEIKTYYLDFVGAYNILPWWSVSAGISYVRSRARLARTSLNGVALNESLISFEGEGWGVSPDFGTQVRLGKQVRLGAAYRGQAVVDHKGDLTIDPPTGGPFGLASQTASTKITLPATFVAGVAVKPIDWWTVEFDWDFTFWQSLKDLDLNLPDDPALDGLLRNSAPYPNRHWHNSHIFRLGTQFQLTEPLAIRFGYAYITTPIPDDTLDPILPDADRTSLSTGLGYAFTKHLTFDLAYEYQHFHERTKNNSVGLNPLLPGAPGLAANGAYKTDAHVIVVQFKYMF